MPSHTQTTDRPSAQGSTKTRTAAHNKAPCTPNQKLVGRFLRTASAVRALPDGRPARMQRPEAVAAINRIMTGLFPDVDLTAINGGLLDERELGRYERGEVRWPSRYRRAALRAFFDVTTDNDLGFYHSRRLEPVLDDETTRQALPPLSLPPHQTQPASLDMASDSGLRLLSHITADGRQPTIPGSGTTVAAGLSGNPERSQPPVGSRRQPPPPGMVAAAEQDYHRGRDDLAGLLKAVKILMASGQSTIETFADVWATLHMQQDNPGVLLIAAAAIMQLASSEQPPSAPRTDEQPQPETR
jgi:hypothetical protein